MPATSRTHRPVVHGSAEHVRRARIHAIRRAGERYGLFFTEQDVVEHEEMIRYRLARLVGSGGTGFLYEIEGEVRSYFAVFNRKMDCIVTYLRGPHEWTGSMRRAGR